MKKNLTVILLIFALLLTMAGCAASGMARSLDIAEERLEEKLDTVEDRMGQKLQPAPEASLSPVSPAETAPPAVPAEPQSAAPATETASLNPQVISREEAQRIALEHVGATADQAKRLRTEYEIDDGIPQYDVEFHIDQLEYEFEIHAETGKILSFDKDRDD